MFDFPKIPLFLMKIMQSLTDGHTCSLPFENPHHISGKRTYFKHQILSFAHKIEFVKFSFFDSHYPFCTSQNWNWFWVSKYLFFVSFCNVFFWQKTLKKVMDVFHSKFNINLCKMDNESQKKQNFSNPILWAKRKIWCLENVRFPHI